MAEDTRPMECAQDCLDELRRLMDTTMSTIGLDGAPQSRVIDVMLAGEGAVYFCTSRGKHFHDELMANGSVSIVGLDEGVRMVRLQGIARKLPDNEQRGWIDRIFDENPVMNNVYPGDARYILDAFVVDSGAVEFFNLGAHPIFRRTWAFGGGSETLKGFLISTGCIGCGTCASACPQEAILEGDPYEIQQEHCLHCGLCYESCLVEAIAHRH